jgi:hypothetical protein
MVDQETFEQLLPLAYQWAKTQEQIILARGVPLTPEHAADARRAGVQDCSRVRVLVVDRLPLPDDQRLAAVARRSNIITAASRGAGIGHGIIIRADCWGDRELLVHQLVHVAQCERSGGLEPFVEHYLRERLTCAHFTIGPLEDEARRIAREIVRAPESDVGGCSAD